MDDGWFSRVSVGSGAVLSAHSAATAWVTWAIVFVTGEQRASCCPVSRLLWGQRPRPPAAQWVHSRGQSGFLWSRTTSAAVTPSLRASAQQWNMPYWMKTWIRSRGIAGGPDCGMHIKINVTLARSWPAVIFCSSDEVRILQHNRRHCLHFYCDISYHTNRKSSCCIIILCSQEEWGKYSWFDKYIYMWQKRLNNERVQRYNLTPDTEARESAAVQRSRALAFLF